MSNLPTAADFILVIRKRERKMARIYEEGVLKLHITSSKNHLLLLPYCVEIG